MGNDFFDGLSETITRTAKEFGERAESLYETQKLRTRIAGEERLAEKAKADLGNLIYQRYETGEDVDDEIAALCEKIAQHYKKINDLKEKAANKRGQKICPSCLKEVDQEVAFCPYCGTPCANPAKEEPECSENCEDAGCEEDCGPQEGCEPECEEEACGECEPKCEEENCGECEPESACGGECISEDENEEHSSQDTALEEEPVEETPVGEAPAEEEK